MNAYAQNSGGGGGYASLTSNLLARKGEALPAVDSIAHEGVDIAMRPMQPANSPGAPAGIDEDAIKTFYAHNPGVRQQASRPANVRLVHSAGPYAEAPQAWTISPAQRAAQRRRAAAENMPDGPAGGVLARKAIVTLKMPARDLVRLRLAARDLEMSCQAIILDALECYLDANDVPSASDDDAIMREIERLMAKAKIRRQS